MKVAFVQPTWTPHSWARLQRAVDHFGAADAVLEVVTIASSQGDYSWADDMKAPEALYGSRDYWAIGYREMRRRLASVLDDSGPDVVVVSGWTFREALSGLGWAIRGGVGRVVISDSQRIDSERNPAREVAKRQVVRAFDGAFVAGTPQLGYVRELGMPADRCFIGCDVVDNTFFSRAVDGPRPASPTLLSCVRLLPRKNLHLVVEVLARSEHPWRWIVAGDGPERSALVEHVAESGLTDRVELPGHIPYERLPETYARADIYLQPSLSEPWGLAVNEAMASGLPVLVSDRCGCHVDLVADGINGTTFDPGSAQSLASALDRMLGRRSDWERMGRASQQRISEWDLDLYAQNLERVCRCAFERRRGGSATTSLLGRIL